MKNHLILLLLILLAFFSVKSCYFDKNNNSIFETEISNLKDSLKVITLENGNTLASVGVLKGTLDEKMKIIEQLSDRNNYLKGQLVIATKFNVDFKLDSSKIKRDTFWKDVIVYKNLNLDSLDRLEPMKDFKEFYKFGYVDSSLNFQFYGTLTNRLQNGKLISSEFKSDSSTIDINGTLAITSTKTKSGNELKSYLSVQSNSILSMNLESKSYFIEKTKNKRYSVGAQLGYGLNTDFKLKPYIGIGIQYNLFSF